MAAELAGFAIEQTYPLFNLRDTVLRKSDPALQPAAIDQPDAYNLALAERHRAPGLPTKLTLGVGMIVKNEQDDLPGCLDSVANCADLICIAEPHRFLAHGYQKLEEWQTAVQHARLYLARVPQDAELQQLLADCLARLQG